jgi:hypothetical protein
MKTGSRQSRALHAAVAAIYFADSSDYKSALWDVVRELDPKMAELLADDESEAYRRSRQRAGHPDD